MSAIMFRLVLKKSFCKEATVLFCCIIDVVVESDATIK